jgi:hypothetical protein
MLEMIFFKKIILKSKFHWSAESRQSYKSSSNGKFGEGEQNQGKC